MQRRLRCTGADAQMTLRLQHHDLVAATQTVAVTVAIEFVNQAFARGRQARYEGDFKKAAELFQVCLEEDPGLLVARYELAETLRRLGRYDQARAQAETTREAALAQGDRPLAADALTTLGLVAWRQGDFLTGSEYVQQALKIHEAEGRRAAAAHDRNILGIILGRRGQEQVATKHYLEALAIFRALGDRAGQAKTLNNLGWHAFNLGDYRTAAEFDTQALAIQQELGLASGAALSLNALGSSHLNRGRFSAAESHYQRSLSIRREIGDRAGRFERAEAAFDHAEQLWLQVGIERARRELSLWRAQLALEAGDLAAARGWLTANQSDDYALAAWAWWLRGRLHRLAGDNEAALHHLNQAIQLARQAGDPRTRIDARIEAAHVCMDIDDDCASTHLHETASWQEEYAPAVVAQGRWLLHQGKPELALRELKRARELAGTTWTAQEQDWLAHASDQGDS